MVPELILTYMSGPRDGEVVRSAVPEDSPEVTFGRSDACAVLIEFDNDVSRTHAKLCWRDGNWWLVDLQSTNGTYLSEFRQSKKVTSPVSVAPGQIFRMGATRFRLEDASSFRMGELSGSQSADREA